MTSGCQGISKPANISPPVCSPKGEAGKNVQTGFFSVDLGFATGFLQRSAVRHHRNGGGANYKNSIYIVNVNFSKIVAFKGMIRKCLNMVAVHIEGLRHPSICLHFI
jgi:hypothetical protein